MEPTPLPPADPNLEGERGLTHQQKVILAVVGALTAALVVALLLALVSSDDPDEALVSGATTTAPPAETEDTTTTVAAPTSTTAAPTTTTGATASTTSSTEAPKPIVDGRGAVLTSAAPSGRRAMTGNDCRTLAVPGATAECGVFRGKGDIDLAWLVESRPVEGGRGGATTTARRAFVLRKAADGKWTPVLEARDDDGTRFAAITARVEDVSGDGAAEVAFGFRRRGAANTLSIDVVEGPGTVVVHRDAPGGSARVSGGQLDVWQSAGDRFDHLTIRYADNAWRIVATVRETAGHVPPSQL